MTAGAGVPPWARPVLIGLETRLSNMIEEPWPSASAWRGALITMRADVRAALAAASGPDAGTGERELCGACIGEGCEVCDGVGFTVDTRHAADCDGTCRNCPVPVQTQCERCAPASGAAPAPDDPIEELEVMLEDFVDAVRRDDPLHPHFDAIRAHVAQRERAAREAGRAEMGEVSDGVRLIAVERQRQIGAEGWTPAHDDTHKGRELAKAAACYALVDADCPPVPALWPWSVLWWKPSSPIRNLVKAGALVAAEIDRLVRRRGKGEGQ